MLDNPNNGIKTGLGDNKITFAVYIANTPNMPEYQNIESIMPLNKGKISAIGQACGNGWRKVFNVYAKLLYALDHKYFNYRNNASTWQQYRDYFLLQPNSHTALLFSPPSLCPLDNTVHIICGKTYAKSLLNSGELQAKLIWLDDEFAIDKTNNLVVCPYFDYRQLSNIKIERLAVMIGELKNKTSAVES